MELKIDIHTHILPAELPRFKEKFGYGGFVCMEKVNACQARLFWDDGRFFREVSQNCWDPEIRLQECDNAKVCVQVLSTVPVMFSYKAKPEDALEVSRFLNNHIATIVRRYPRRFVGLASVPLQSAKLAIDELKRSMEVLGLCGAQIGTHVNGYNLDDLQLLPFFAEAERLGAALFVHPWDMLGTERMSKYWLPWLVGMPTELSLAICSLIFGGVLERFPGLRIAFAHGGGAFAGTVGRIEHGYRVRPDLCQVNSHGNPLSYTKRIYVDTLVHDVRALKYCLDLFGPERMALGTDYPFPLGEERPGELISQIPGLTNEVRERLFAGTALEWLGKKKEDFV